MFTTTEMRAMNRVTISEKVFGFNHLSDMADSGAVPPVTKRFLAAIRSSRWRGDVKCDFTILGAHMMEDDGCSMWITRKVRVTITSTGGQWSRRAYQMSAILDVGEDQYGVVRVAPGGGAYAAVTNDAGDGTMFVGSTVGHLIAEVWRTSQVARMWAAGVLNPPATPAPAPEWHQYARGALMDVLEYADDFQVAASAVARLSDAHAIEVVRCLECEFACSVGILNAAREKNPAGWVDDMWDWAGDDMRADPATCILDWITVAREGL